jgi:hypothetical protein
VRSVHSYFSNLDATLSKCLKSNDMTFVTLCRFHPESSLSSGMDDRLYQVGLQVFD